MNPRRSAASHEAYLVTCWNCLGEFDALTAVWCSDDAKNPTKLCPFCFRCFCAASEKYKQEFWRRAPARLQDELSTLGKSRDRLGDVLIRMKKITIPQLLEALVEQKATGKRLGEIFVDKGVVKPEDITIALRTQGSNPLTDTLGIAYAAGPVWEGTPEAIIQYILSLAARKGASDVHIEPKEETISVKYRIDDFFFRVDPIPKALQEPLTLKLFEMFNLDPSRAARPQRSRTTATYGNQEYDVVTQTLPTAAGVSATIKLVNRSTFLKDILSLGVDTDDRVRLLEELKSSFGLALVTSPVFNGANTTAYSLMNHLVRAGRDVVSLESPVQWPLEGARQVEVEKGDGNRMDEVLRSVIAVRPEVLVLFTVPDAATAQLVTQLASSLLVIAVMPAQSAAQAVVNFVQLGVARPLLAGSLAAVTSQRLVRQICRICLQPADPPAAQTLASHGISAEEAANLLFFRGKGCPTCNRVGYRGRRALFEVLTGSPEVRTAVLNGREARELASVAVESGMRTLRSHCLRLIREGTTTFDEFVRMKL